MPAYEMCGETSYLPVFGEAKRPRGNVRGICPEEYVQGGMSYTRVRLLPVPYASLVVRTGIRPPLLHCSTKVPLHTWSFLALGRMTASSSGCTGRPVTTSCRLRQTLTFTSVVLTTYVLLLVRLTVQPCVNFFVHKPVLGLNYCSAESHRCIFK